MKLVRREFCKKTNPSTSSENILLGAGASLLLFDQVYSSVTGVKGSRHTFMEGAGTQEYSTISELP